MMATDDLNRHDDTNKKQLLIILCASKQAHWRRVSENRIFVKTFGPPTLEELCLQIGMRVFSNSFGMSKATSTIKGSPTASNSLKSNVPASSVS